MAPLAGPRWNSRQFERVVLVVGRTLTSTAWILDLFTELATDTRLQIVFTSESTQPSVFAAGTDRLLDELGVIRITWDEATTTTFDLVIAAHHTGDLHLLSGPLLLLPHGPGFAKLTARPANRTVPSPAHGTGQTTLILGHRDDVTGYDVDVANVDVVVAGDPLRDRLTTSRELRRPAYRDALGLTDAHTLVVTSSTWGPASQFSRRPELAATLLTNLPIDDYKVASILHPNIWAAHSEWQLRSWLRDELAAGLMLLAPRDGWRTGLIAADVVIADHGSVLLYALDLGLPVLLSDVDTSELRADAPLTRALEHLPRLDLNAPIAAQIDAASETIDVDLHHQVSAAVFERPGQALRVILDTMYELLELEPSNRQPVVRAVEPAAVEQTQIDAYIVDADVTVDTHDVVHIDLQRFAAKPPPPPEISRSRSRHLVVTTSCSDPLQFANAAVIVHDSENKPSDISAWARTVLDQYPGLRIAATPQGRHTAAVARRGDTTVSIDVRTTSSGRLPPSVHASIAYLCEIRRLPADTRANVRLGRTIETVSVETVQLNSDI
jgi:hypothetical protein